MPESKFSSVFAREIKLYLEDQISAGYKLESFISPLRIFDRFCVEQGLTQPQFTQIHAQKWIERRKNEGSTTQYSRVNLIKNFLIYLSRKDYQVFIPRDIRYIPTDFQPHIYSDDEIERYFYAVDTYESSRSPMLAIQFPVLFRLLYSCGTRISETLGIKKEDVDLDKGIIKLYETKNYNERYIVLSDSLTDILRQYCEKCFYLLKDDDFIFSSINGGRISADSVQEYHMKFLSKAGIPFLGGGKGPRLHDFRHTFALRSFKQMIDLGLDMYVALPILSTYLGHKTIYATERYVRLTMSMYPYIEKKFQDKLDMVFGEETQ